MPGPDPDGRLPTGEDALRAILGAGAVEAHSDDLLLAKFEQGPLTPEQIAKALGEPHQFGPGEGQEWAEEMVDRGLLEPAETPDAYELSSEGRQIIE